MLLLADFAAPAFVAHGGVAVVAAEHDLGALGDDVAVAVDAGIDSRLCAARADRFDLGDGVGEFHEPPRSREEVSLKIGPEAEAQHRDVLVVDDVAQFVDLFRREKLALIGDDDGGFSMFAEFPENGVGGQNDLRVLGEADPAPDDVGAIPRVGGRLDEPDCHALFFIVEFCDQRLGGF